MTKRGPEHHSFRLPVAPSEPPPPSCDRAIGPRPHGPGIRFQLVRYGRVVGTILLCGDCLTDLRAPSPRPDPLHVEEAA